MSRFVGHQSTGFVASVPTCIQIMLFNYFCFDVHLFLFIALTSGYCIHDRRHGCLYMYKPLSRKRKLRALSK